MKRIYKTFWGLTIDLSKVSVVGECVSTNGFSASFYIVVDGLRIDYSVGVNSPMDEKSGLHPGQIFDDIHYKWEHVYYHSGMYGYEYRGYPVIGGDGRYVVCIKLQKQIDSLINDWVEYVNDIDV